MIYGYLFVGFVLFLLGCYLFDEVIKYQYSNYPEEWMKDGKPKGYGFSPKGGSYLSMNMIAFKFAFGKKTPIWVLNDKEALKKYGRLSVFNKVWFWYCLAVFPVAIIAVST
ncbi:hypothetical protein R50073_35620 [Maricurvus nonylphenolicus]|uniref:hypothetical protein n=1 Tax=Maricurvus nonylphenolicus TaxID=1008307 RepID=UPI0036F2AEBB